MALPEITEHIADLDGHKAFYLAAGPEDGPLVIFVHGWPELSLSWRNQLPVLGSLGFRAVAPDMRGYGRSSVYDSHDAYAQERVVADMLGLLAHLGADKAVWVGHDWGAPTVWNIASHHPETCHAVANLCVPYLGLDNMLELIDREIYPADQFPAGQWEYQAYYLENFDRAVEVLGANSYNSVKAMFRRGDPDGKGKPANTAYVRIGGGWFGGADAAPELPIDHAVVSEQDLRAYAAALDRNSFFGPCSYYMNHPANAAYAATALNDSYLDMPVLFLAAEYDYTCETVDSKLADPMRKYCRDLTWQTVQSGHWMAQEKPVAVNAALTRFIATKAPEIWPQGA